MADVHDKKAEKKNHWHTMIMALNFFIPFHGLKIMLESYLQEDRLPLTYFFILGLVSALLAGIIVFVTRGKTIKIKITSTALLLLIVIVLNSLIN